MQDILFYQSHLDQVSRSFAACIAQLRAPMRSWISLSYLLFRVLDTVEDSEWEQIALQDKQYDLFDAFVNCSPEPQEVEKWVSRFPSSISENEKKLLTNSKLLFDDLHELSVKVKSAIQASLLRMSLGMRHYSARKTQITDMVDLNRYCYFVAGIVGELLSRLFVELRPDFVEPPAFLKNAFHFGLFLQKVNILKDQRSDEKVGRFLVPDRNLILTSMKANAQGSFQYLLSIPKEEKGFRTFCGWSLFLGLSSLPWIQKAHAADDGSKIPRTVTKELLGSLEKIIDDDEALKNAWNTYHPMFLDFPEVVEAPKVPDFGDWFCKISGNLLSTSELTELKLV